MKKTLALILAMMMVIGLMTTGAAASSASDLAPENTAMSRTVDKMQALWSDDTCFLVYDNYLLQPQQDGTVRIVSDWVVGCFTGEGMFSVYYITDGALRVYYRASDGRLHDGVYTPNDTVVSAIWQSDIIITYDAAGNATWYHMGLLG